MPLNRHLRRGLRAALCAALCAALFAGIAAAQEAPEAKPRADISRFGARVEAALGEARAGKGFWGVLVVDADTGETLYALNAQRYFAPASSAKLFTTALAMATLGPSYRFRTTIETRGAVDASGRLRGDLVLVGRGDPTSPTAGSHSTSRSSGTARRKRCWPNLPVR